MKSILSIAVLTTAISTAASAPNKVKWPGVPPAKSPQNTTALKLRTLGEIAPRPLKRNYSKYVEVFGIGVYASPATPDAKVLHAANVLAQYLDNDEDGKPDNPRVVAAMKENKAGIGMFATERDVNHRGDGDLNLQSLYGEETIPGGSKRGEFDATYEEVLHSITQFGYAKAYPEVFGERPGSKVAKAMDKARGGHFRRVPDKYPADAWYTYYDETCDYGCQVTEYTYWGLTSILGTQDYAGRGEEIEEEWRLNTAEKVKTGDPDLYQLLTDPQYRFPTVLPDGTYTPKKP